MPTSRVPTHASTAALAVVLGFAIGSACSEESARERAEDGVRPIIEAQCRWMFDCCSTGERTVFLGPFTVDAENCVDRLMLALEAGPGIALPLGVTPLLDLLYVTYDLDTGRIDLDQGAIDRCADFLAVKECNAAPDPNAEPVDPERCVAGQLPPASECDPDEMVIGRQEVGEECNPASDFECKKGLRCIDYGYVGICSHVSAEGEYCFSDRECSDDLFCDFTTGTCAVGAQLGQPCAYENPLNPVPGTELVRCAAGLSCDPESLTCVDYCAPGAVCGSEYDCPEDYVCVLGRCRMPGGEGEACGKNADCQSDACDLVTSTCQSRKPVGTTCFSHDECNSRYCGPSGLCERGSAPGEPCPSAQHLECIGSWCDTMSDPLAPVCRGFLGEGQPCFDAYACDSAADLQCVDGICRTLPVPNGVPCTISQMCQSQLCWEGVCQDGAPIGSTCSFTGFDKPCANTAYCLLTGASGVCTAKIAAGMPCETAEQCFGSCIDVWGARLCDATAAPQTAVCDGPL